MADSAVSIDALFAGRETPVARDLKLNLKKLLSDSSIAGTEASLALLALATSLEAPALSDLALALLADADLSPDQLQEAKESAAIMGMLNTYYRFRHFLGSGQGQAYVDEHYKTAGLRMNSLSKPALGKERFEMLALAVSVVNGCEMCVNAHEQELLKLGASRDKLHDLARLAAVAKGVSTLR
ncbi:MAG: carboxymuconolactone decarboxylase family protein [Proteobacteria bacterium]|nr:carboxymuconolactone decarboxylase family protein [Pseudomonadota bacterium]